eukprot:4323601-Prymnesium_polylepis.1
MLCDFESLAIGERFYRLPTDRSRAGSVGRGGRVRGWEAKPRASRAGRERHTPNLPVQPKASP